MAWKQIILAGDIEATDPLALAGDVTIVGSGKSLEVINLKAETATELTIATGDITVTQLYHNVDTEADAATDDLVGINGGNDGQLLILRPNNDARTVVVKHNGSAAAADNILMANNDDFSMDDEDDVLLLIYEAALDTNGAWVEIARNIGAAAVLSDTVPNTIEPDDAASAGTASEASRQDHEHAIVAAVPSSVGTTAAEGTGTSFVRNDHVHDLGNGSIDAAALFAADVVEPAAVLDTGVFTMGKLTLTGADPSSEIILTPKVSSASTTEGTMFYDSDDNHLYVYVV